MRLFHGLALLILLSHLAMAATSLFNTPGPLQPWVSWVLEGQEHVRCPVLYNNVEQHRCAWPSALLLDIQPQGGDFVQRWRADAETWLSLPGDRRHWPQEVELNGVSTVVLERDGRPIIKAGTGEHTVSGRFPWRAIPEALRVPSDTALLSLTVRGNPVANPRIETDGRVWLRKRTTPTQEDHLEIEAFRLITDGIPLVLTTRLILKVSGQPREILLGRALPQAFIPLSLESPLPARLEPDSRVRLQVKPGTWVIELRARHPGPVDALSRPEPDGPWATEEIWSFQALNALRIVTVEGAPSLDPTQTNLPQDWRQLPAYLLQPGQSLHLITRKRGDADPAPDRLSLEKTLWLDFDGGGYTVQDRLSGIISQSTRLEAIPGVQLGRVAINGEDQVITQLPGSDADGVEVRQGTIELTADSRLQPGDIGDLPAVGWQVSPTNSRTLLNLPPGWRLLSVTGADSASDTWLYRWNLLDIFVVLIIALSFARLWGWPYGLLALAGMLLIYHEPNAPQLLWLNLLAAIALLRVLPPGRLRYLTGWYRGAALLALLVVGLVFAVQQVRSGLYPQLASESFILPGTLIATAPVPGRHVAESIVAEEIADQRGQVAKTPAISRFRLKQIYAPDLQIQTGPGLPTWRWRQAVLVWSGPVAAEQRLGLMLLSPWSARVLIFTGVILLLAMFIRVLGPIPLKLPRHSPGLVLLLLPAFFGMAPEGRADIPSPALLEELRARLTEAPDCQPVCATLATLDIQVTNDTLRLSLYLHSAVDTAVPLPFPGRRLTPSQVSLGQKPVPLYRDLDGLLWARLPMGRHTLEITTALPADLASLQIPLPMTPGWVELEIRGKEWQAEGIYQGFAEGQIQLTRQSDAAVLQPGAMPPFMQVERELMLGIDWQVQTQVQRLGQTDSAAVLEIPLLTGERVTTPGVRVQDNRVLLNLSPQQAQISWSSTLEKTERLTLQAADTTDFVEIWRLHAEPLWHVEAAGIPVIHRHNASGQWLPEWRPWPGESVTLDISRPQGAEGKTVTIDSAWLQVNPGKRATETHLDLLIRSSRGTEHTLMLPEGAELTGVLINNESQPIKQSGQALVLPLTPGAQQIKLTWRRPQGITTRYTTPIVDLGLDSVNNRITLTLPRDRWTLFTSGPILGPAVLFWGVLIVIALGALALGRYGQTPLKAWQWFLLGVGLSQASVLTILLVAGWLLLLGRRKELGENLGNLSFNLLQVLLALLTLASLAALLGAIEQGLLGSPSMQITGNGSSAYQLQWYQDRSAGTLPQAWAVSVPLIIYRGLMLAWALWLAFALLKWLGWAWTCFSSGGIWRRLKLTKAKA